MRTQTSVGLASAWGSSWSAHDLDAALGFCAPDILFEGTTPPDGERVLGHAGLREVWTPIFENPATHVEVEDTVVAGDRVVQRCLHALTGSQLTLPGRHAEIEREGCERSA